jgi:type IV pilus assembly protein PilB
MSARGNPRDRAGHADHDRGAAAGADRRHLGTEVIDLKGIDIPPDVIRRVPASVARMYNVVPIEADSRLVELATSDLLSPEVVDELMFVLTRDVSVRSRARPTSSPRIKRSTATTANRSARCFRRWRTSWRTPATGINLGARRRRCTRSNGGQRRAGGPVREPGALPGRQDRASDIHFEPFENEFKIRYRVDGALYEMAPPPKHLALPVTSRIKVISGLNIAERRLPQDGRIQLNVGGRTIDFRVSTLPTQFGESVVLRVLDRSVVSLDLENLGMPDDVLPDFGDRHHQAQRHRHRHRPDRFGQDHHALFRAAR